jgi:DNA helicase-2/ATP-dependent DNA helicase PcrA
MGYGKSIHDALAEVHAEALRGRIASPEDAGRLIQDHLILPFAGSELRQRLTESAVACLRRYLVAHQHELSGVEYVEKPVEVQLGDGIVVVGRVDLICRRESGEVSIVDFKSTHRAQAEDVSLEQLHVYAVGYEKLTGKPADVIEIHNLDHDDCHREKVEGTSLARTMSTIHAAGRGLVENHLPRLPAGCSECASCDHVGICREGP